VSTIGEGSTVSGTQAARLARPPIVAIASGKGGVGKTVLAVNLAIQLGRCGYRPLLVDLDPGLANADVHLRLHPPLTLRDCLEQTATPEECVIAGPGGMRLLPGGSGVSAMARLTGEAEGAFWRSLAGVFGDCGVVIIDTGAGIGPGPMGAIARADHLILVTTPEPPALTDAYALLKLVTLERYAARPFLVINEARGRGEALAAATTLRSVAVEHLRCAAPELLGWLRSDPLVESSVRRQKPFILWPRSGLHDDLDAIAAALLARMPDVRRFPQPPGQVRPIQG
jgi:flagellar biosynthesis protein FlhG